MVAFRTANEAVSFAIEFSQNTGADHIGIRVGINSGDVEIRENDIYGLNVNFTARVQHASSGEGILVANSVKRDYDKRFGENSGVKFVPKEVELKSFGKETLYLVGTPGLVKAARTHRLARMSLLETGRFRPKAS